MTDGRRTFALSFLSLRSALAVALASFSFSHVRDSGISLSLLGPLVGDLTVAFLWVETEAWLDSLIVPSRLYVDRGQACSPSARNLVVCRLLDSEVSLDSLHVVDVCSGPSLCFVNDGPSDGMIWCTLAAISAAGIRAQLSSIVSSCMHRRLCYAVAPVAWLLALNLLELSRCSDQRTLQLVARTTLAFFCA